MSNEILIYICVAIVFLFVLKVFKVKWRFIFSLLFNILVGGLLLYLVNYIPGINLELNIVNSLVVGILGVPGVIILLVLHFIK